MPTAYAVDPARRLAAVTLAGPLRGPDLVRAVRALHGDPRWRPEFDTVWDGMALTGLHLDLPDVHAVADLRFGPDPAQAPSPAAPAAPSDAVPTGRGVLVARREVDEEVAHLFAAIARRHGREARVVRSVAEALAVLGHGPAVWDGLEWSPVDEPGDGA